MEAASKIINSMDETADPCTDFYQFACGGFVAETVRLLFQTIKQAKGHYQSGINLLKDLEIYLNQISLFLGVCVLPRPARR